jgi:hypothetical protein
VEYQQIGAWWHGPVVSTDVSFPGGRGCPGKRPARFRWVVFGTLLGPEATGPGGFFLPGLFVSGFLAASIMHGGPSGVVCGVCGLGLLFENYIVDASIFYKKQFPRI